MDSLRAFIATPLGSVVFYVVLIMYPTLFVILLAWYIGHLILGWFANRF